ncbi:MAG: tRNA pseudouridine(38-40) synthase TruA [Chlorobiaceae bacterium]|nr:tRNA pseudouridine(38-40) synthase TruA [Chlorobiaceae bacterium]
MKNIRLDIEYDGTDFSGWQRQAGSIPTVQGTIESVLGRIVQEDVRIYGAGRTDKGVHARGQTANFTTGSNLEIGRLLHSANSLLPGSIRIIGMRQVGQEFHSRFSAVLREYRYFMIETPSAIDGRFAGCCHGRPDPEIMNRIASSLSGTHDFSAFSKEDPQQEGCECTVTSAVWYRWGRYHVFRITANRFLRSMVRYLVSGMVETGLGRMAEEGFSMMLMGGVRSHHLVPVDPAGLFLWKVSYGTADCKPIGIPEN